MTGPESPTPRHDPSSTDGARDLPRAVEVTAASRLHFGLLAWGGSGRQFGGVGMMVEPPSVRLRVRAAEEFQARGPHAARVAQFVQKWYAAVGGLAAARVACEVVEAPPQHVGLGLGTQLGLAVGAALDWFHAAHPASPGALAERMGRGVRSAVGTYGFFQGGLIFEPGKLADEVIAPQAERCAVPDAWRIMLLRPLGPSGEAGEVERRAFATLPPIPAPRTQQLLDIVHGRLLPALRRADCGEFGEAVYDYGRLAGECFAPWQGGPFNGPRLTALVERLRRWGVAGVGQSSWGPTLFAIVASEAAAQDLAGRLRAEPDEADLDLLVARPANAGARVRDLTGVRFAHD